MGVGVYVPPFDAAFVAPLAAFSCVRFTAAFTFVGFVARARFFMARNLQ